jgi:hypothetical protein
MGVESGFWKTIRKKAGGEWQRIENSVMKGMPDCLVLYPCGTVRMVELKDLKDKWHNDISLSPEQRLWHGRWHRKGGTSFVLTRYKRTFFLVRGSDIFKTASRLEWYNVALGIWQGAINWNELNSLILLDGSNDRSSSADNERPSDG